MPCAVADCWCWLADATVVPLASAFPASGYCESDANAVHFAVMANQPKNGSDVTDGAVPSKTPPRASRWGCLLELGGLLLLLVLGFLITGKDQLSTLNSGGLPPDLAESIRRTMKPLSGGFFAPSPVEREQPFEAVLRISPPEKSPKAIVAELEAEAGRTGVSAFSTIEFQPVYEASLTSDRDARIVLQGEAPSRAVIEGREITWRWYVTATSGPLNLTATLTAPLVIDGSPTGSEVVSFKQTITVNVTGGQRVKDFIDTLNTYWQAIAGIAGLLAVLWAWRRRRTEGSYLVAKIKPKLKVLFLAADPFKTNALRLDEEIREIQHRIDASQERRVEIVSAWAVRPSDLQSLILRHSPSVVHFSGHGTDSKTLVLQGPDREPREVSGKALEELFEIFSHRVQVVVLNACHSSRDAEAIAKWVDFAIGMNAAIGDNAATSFSAAFYGALAAGESVTNAFRLGKNAIALDGLSEDEKPQLYRDEKQGG